MKNREIDDLPTNTFFFASRVLSYRQRDVRLFSYQTPDQLLMRCQRKLLLTAKLRRTDATRVAVKPEEAYRQN